MAPQTRGFARGSSKPRKAKQSRARETEKTAREGRVSTRARKYTPDILAQMFIRAASLRNEMLDLDFTDNGGAIHSAERILNGLGMTLVHPELSHTNALKKLKGAPCSVGAREAREMGIPVFVEHVAPLRHMTQTAIEKIKDLRGADARRVLKAFVKKNYKLVLLTDQEMRRLNQRNRSKMSPTRLEDAGIKLCRRG